MGFPSRWFSASFDDDEIVGVRNLLARLPLQHSVIPERVIDDDVDLVLDVGNVGPTLDDAARVGVV